MFVRVCQIIVKLFFTGIIIYIIYPVINREFGILNIFSEPFLKQMQGTSEIILLEIFVGIIIAGESRDHSLPIF
jgi:hypothetical protein